MTRKIYGIFVAGGSGTRMGSEVPKQFLELKGETILQRTIEVFLDALPDMEVITVLPREHMKTWKELCIKGSFCHPQTLVTGGITRFHSVKNALKKVPDGAIVLIHDGVRPFAPVEMIRRMVGKMEECRALIPVIPCTDTLRSVRPGEPDPDRSGIVCVQTPQIFLSEEIKAAYGQAYDVRFTDDGSVAAAYGIPLDFAEGNKFNIKITTKEDLLLAQAIMTLADRMEDGVLEVPDPNLP